MPPKQKTVYVCNECGFESPKWMGQCPSCNSWNTLEEQLVVAKSKDRTSSLSSSGPVAGKSLFSISESDEERYVTGISELDRVLGG